MEDAVKVAEMTADASGVRGGVMEFERLSWENAEEYEEGGFDLVVGSDVLFGRWCAEPVSKVVGRCMRRGGMAIIGTL